MKIKFHAANEYLLLHHIRLILEILHEVCHELVCVVDDLNILSNNPNNRGLCFRVIKVVQVLANVSKQSFIFIRVFPENVPNHYYCFLNHIWNFGLKSFPQALNTFIGHFLQFNSTFTHGVDCFSNKLNVNFMNVLL
jgi:hypothetical protein